MKDNKIPKHLLALGDFVAWLHVSLCALWLFVPGLLGAEEFMLD